VSSRPLLSHYGTYLGHCIVGGSLLRPEALQLLAEGKAMKEVAAVLGISPRTVASHEYRLMESLGIRTNAELVQFAVRRRVV